MEQTTLEDIEAGFKDLVYYLDKGFNNFYDCSHVFFSKCCDMFEETCLMTS